jgi:hypothetical protein
MASYEKEGEILESISPEQLLYRQITLIQLADYNGDRRSYDRCVYGLVDMLDSEADQEFREGLARCVWREIASYNLGTNEFPCGSISGFSYGKRGVKVFTDTRLMYSACLSLMSRKGLWFTKRTTEVFR